MTEDMINEMYLIAVKSKLQKGAISLEEKVRYIIEELNQEGIITNSKKPCSEKPKSIETVESVGIMTRESVSVTPKVQKEIKYAQMPDEAGFSNRELDNSPENQYYLLEINRESNEGEFNLMTEIRVAEEYKVSQGIAPLYAVVFDNHSTDGTRLRVVKKGILRKVGKYWTIVEPCHMKWS